MRAGIWQPHPVHLGSRCGPVPAEDDPSKATGTPTVMNAAVRCSVRTDPLQTPDQRLDAVSAWLLLQRSIGEL